MKRPTLSLTRVAHKTDFVEYGIVVKEVEGHPKIKKPYTCWYKSRKEREAAYNQLRNKKTSNRIYVDRTERKTKVLL